MTASLTPSNAPRGVKLLASARVAAAAILVAILAGCGGGPQQKTAPKQIVGAGATATQSTSSSQWVVNALDAARERLGGKALGAVVGLLGMAALAGLGWSLLLLNLDAPTSGKLRATLILAAVGMLAAPAALLIMYAGAMLR